MCTLPRWPPPGRSQASPLDLAPERSWPGRPPARLCPGQSAPFGTKPYFAQPVAGMNSSECAEAWPTGRLTPQYGRPLLNVLTHTRCRGSSRMRGPRRRPEAGAGVCGMADTSVWKCRAKYGNRTDIWGGHRYQALSTHARAIAHITAASLAFHHGSCWGRERLPHSPTVTEKLGWGAVKLSWAAHPLAGTMMMINTTRRRAVCPSARIQVNADILLGTPPAAE